VFAFFTFVLCTFVIYVPSTHRITILILVVPLNVVSVEQAMEMDLNGYVTFIVFQFWPKNDDDKEEEEKIQY
jgi:hypothetical protein